MLYVLKTRHRYIIIVLSVLFFGACRKQLDQIPKTELTEGSFWKTTNDLRLACNYLYVYLPGFAGDPQIQSEYRPEPQPYQDLYSDIAFATSGNSVSNGSRPVPATIRDWGLFYKLIRAANSVIVNAPNVTGKPEDIARYTGEARFFRAWAYFELMKRWGDVQIATTPISSATDTLLYTKRSSRQEVIALIYEDLDYAAANCPQADVMAAADYGRITRSAALGFKSRVALFAGTWDKARGIATANSNLQIALDAANAVITEGKHSLYTAQGANSYSYAFQFDGGATGNPLTVAVGPEKNYTYATNKENLMVRLYGVALGNNISSHSFVRGSLEQGNFVGTKNLLDMYLYKDGLPVGKSAWDSSVNQTSSLTDFQNRDPRLSATYWIKGETYPQTSGLTKFAPGIVYKLKKMFVVSEWTQQTSFYNYNILRYAEVLLNYAEAKYELEGAISDGDLDKTINALRNRATGNDVTKLPLLTNAFATVNGLNIRDEIRRERTIELAFEGFRYWDLLRWKIAETILPQAIMGRRYFVGESGTGTIPNNLDDNDFLILEPIANRTFNVSKDYLWPVPTNEITLSKEAISQNPGWE